MLNVYIRVPITPNNSHNWRLPDISALAPLPRHQTIACRVSRFPQQLVMIEFLWSVKSYIFNLLILCLPSVGVTGLSAADFYRWMDQNGVVHFTDNLHNIPAKQRGTVTRIKSLDNPKVTDPPKPTPATKASVPFEKHGQVVVIEAMLNNKTSAKFVVDTGASYTMISSATARELTIHPIQNQRTMPFQTANGVIQAPLTSLESVTVGGLEIKNLTAAIHDVIPDSKVAGLLGLNFLSNFRLDIDTQKGMLHLEQK